GDCRRCLSSRPRGDARGRGQRAQSGSQGRPARYPAGSFEPGPWRVHAAGLAYPRVRVSAQPRGRVARGVGRAGVKLEGRFGLVGRPGGQQANKQGDVMLKLSDAVSRTALAVAAAGTLWSTAAFADPLALFDPLFRPRTAFDEALRDRSPSAADPVLHSRTPTVDEGTAGTAELPANLRRQVVAYPTSEAPGTIVIDTPRTYLYLVLGGGKAMR